MASTITVKKGLKASLPTLSIGEFGLCTDTYELYMGTALGNVKITLDGSVPGGIINQRTGLELKFWMGSKSQWDALQTRDTNTVYLIQDGWLGAIKFYTGS